MLDVEVPLFAVRNHIAQVREADALSQPRRRTQFAARRLVQAIRKRIAQERQGSDSVETGDLIGNDGESGAAESRRARSHTSCGTVKDSSATPKYSLRS